jgi:competence protein ComGF
MKLSQKIAGFTLLEAMVSLLLTTVLVALSFGIYTNFTKGYIIFDQSTARLTGLLQFKNAISSDWFRADFPKGNAAYFELYDQKQDRLISYEISEQQVIRYSVVNDTFDISIKEMEFSYLDPQEEIIDEVLIEFEKNKQFFSVSLKKDHDLKTRMKYNVD